MLLLASAIVVLVAYSLVYLGYTLRMQEVYGVSGWQAFRLGVIWPFGVLILYGETLADRSNRPPPVPVRRFTSS